MCGYYTSDWVDRESGTQRTDKTGNWNPKLDELKPQLSQNNQLGIYVCLVVCLF